MDFWFEQADKLETALLKNSGPVLLHFLRTAPPEMLEEVAGDALPTSENTRASVVVTLAARLAQVR